MVPSRRLCAIAVIALLAVQACLIVARADRAPSVDEIEHLHAAWLMSQGEHIYSAFFEHHPPLFLALLSSIAPEGDAPDDARAYVVHAHLLAGFFGLIASGALAVLLWRIAPESAVVTTALLLVSWTDGGVFGEIRADPAALALFWSGAALVVLSRKPAAIAAGAGIGLIVLAALCSLKWPLCSLVIGVYWLARLRGASRRDKLASVATALAIAGLSLIAIRLLVPLDQWWFFNVEFNAEAGRRARQSAGLLHFFRDPYLYLPSPFRARVLLPCALLVATALFADRGEHLSERGGSLLLLSLLGAAVIEVRFVYPFPVIWWHYFAMWAMTGAAVLSLVPRSLFVLATKARISERVPPVVAAGAATMAILLALANVAMFFPRKGDDTAPYWASQAYLAQRRRLGDTVWMEPNRHPIFVRDAHYYWFGMGIAVPMLEIAQELRATPRGSRFLPPTEPLPVCRSDVSLRFVDAAMARLEPDCFSRLRRDGTLRPTPVPQVFEMTRAH